MQPLASEAGFGKVKSSPKVSLDDCDGSSQSSSQKYDHSLAWPPLLTPASPSTNFLLRNSVSAAHSSEQIDRIIAAYAGLKESGLLTTDQAA